MEHMEMETYSIIRSNYSKINKSGKSFSKTEFIALLKSNELVLLQMNVKTI